MINRIFNISKPTLFVPKFMLDKYKYSLSILFPIDDKVKCILISGAHGKPLLWKASQRKDIRHLRKINSLKYHIKSHNTKGQFFVIISNIKRCHSYLIAKSY